MKLEVGECRHCGKKVTEENSRAFEWDHISRENKKSTIFHLCTKNGQSKKEIDEEIAKCQLLCYRDHKIKTSWDFIPGHTYLIVE
jgi:hypothetical protein